MFQENRLDAIESSREASQAGVNERLQCENTEEEIEGLQSVRIVVNEADTEKSEQVFEMAPQSSRLSNLEEITDPFEIRKNLEIKMKQDSLNKDKIGTPVFESNKKISVKQSAAASTPQTPVRERKTQARNPRFQSQTIASSSAKDNMSLEQRLKNEEIVIPHIPGLGDSMVSK